MPRKAKRQTIRRGRQCAALPFRQADGETQVMLVTSRETRRWVLPKGWTEKCGGAKQAEREAFEEAGIRGRITPVPIGAYAYPKRLADGATVTCKVEVFPLAVDELLEDWPEKSQRERRWFTLPQAAMAVDEGGLVTLMLNLAQPEA
ncbi:NUDIX hydrolase [Belnapia sp. F-4-1]|uniref:NUDIX hydrolase n=1 Tax=Belnapia sp. F-4-1 TaxID=1545443 RepID=UPI0006923222|nr:NUDIX hydrolase [Belnapia sp. F-4-1]